MRGARFGAGAKRLLTRHLPRQRNSWLISRLDRLCVAFHQAYENHSYDFHDNGERFVLEMLARQPNVSVVFDVGANIGDWAMMAAPMFPGAAIHAFEIIPETYEAMRIRCAELGAVHPHPFGLSDTYGEVSVFYPKELSVVSSCVPDIARMLLEVETTTVVGKVTTGDRFCAEQGIDHIDFLKVDVEGFEPQVVRGFQGMLASGKIGMIQFEYGYANVMTRFLLKDFYELLEPCGMKIGKIFPDHVEFRDYDLRQEDFLGPNYLAVHATMTGLLRDLAN
jgi:FkbM family methyltransferase